MANRLYVINISQAETIFCQCDLTNDNDGWSRFSAMPLP